MYIVDLYRELNDWYDIKRSAKKNQKFLTEQGLRVDFVGRIYTVINVPDELFKDTPSRENYVYQKLREYDDILIQLQINELVYPTIEMIPNTTSYLLVLQGNTDYVQFWKIFGHFLLYTGYFIALKFIITVISKNTDIFTNIFNFIKTYI